MSGNDCVVSGHDLNNKRVGFKACRAGVANALISVGEVTQRNFVTMYRNTGAILPMDCPPVRTFLKEMKRYIDAGGDYTPVHKERNVYKIYLRVPGNVSQAEKYEIHSDVNENMQESNDSVEMDIEGFAGTSRPFQGRPLQA